MAVNLMNSEQLFRISGRDVIFNIILKRRSSWNQIQYCLPLLNAGMVDHNLELHQSTMSHLRYDLPRWASFRQFGRWDRRR